MWRLGIAGLIFAAAILHVWKAGRLRRAGSNFDSNALLIASNGQFLSVQEMRLRQESACKWLHPSVEVESPFQTSPNSRWISCETSMLDWTAFDADTRRLRLADDVDESLLPNDAGSSIVAGKPGQSFFQDFISYACYYAELVDNEPSTGSQEITIGPQFPLKPGLSVEVEFETFAVGCRNSTGDLNYLKTFPNFGASYRDKVTPSMAVLVLEGVSQTTMRWQMPNIWTSATQFGFSSFSRFNPDLGGPEALKQLFGSEDKVSFDVHRKSVWRKMRDRGCRTFLNADFDAVGNVSSSFLRKLRASGDFDLTSRRFHEYNRKFLDAGECLADGRLKLEEHVRIWANFSVQHQEICHFSVTFVPATENFAVLDDVVGKIQFETGAFLLRLPAGYRSAFPSRVANIAANANRLVTAGNVKSTLMDLASSGIAPESAKQDSSLLRQMLAQNRTCNQAGIPLESCFCAQISTTTEASRYRIGNISKNLEDLLRVEFSTQKCVGLHSVVVTDVNEYKWHQTITPVVLFVFHVDVRLRPAVGRRHKRLHFAGEAIQRPNDSLELLGQLLFEAVDGSNCGSEADLEIDRICEKCFFD